MKKDNNNPFFSFKKTALCFAPLNFPTFFHACFNYVYSWPPPPSRLLLLSFFVASSTFRWLFCVVVIITTKLIKRSTLTPLLTQHNRNSTKLVFLFFDQPTNQANMIIKFCHVLFCLCIFMLLRYAMHHRHHYHHQCHTQKTKTGQFIFLKS